MGMKGLLKRTCEDERGEDEMIKRGQQGNGGAKLSEERGETRLGKQCRKKKYKQHWPGGADRAV